MNAPTPLPVSPALLWRAGDVPQPSPDVVPPSLHPPPLPPTTPNEIPPETPPEINEPALPGEHSPVRDPVVPVQHDRPWH